MARTKITETVALRALNDLQINDSVVTQRRSARIRNRNEINLRSKDIPVDLNLNIIIDKNIHVAPRVSKASCDNEFELKRENVHFLRATKEFTYITRNEYVRRRKVLADIVDECDCEHTNEIQNGQLGCVELCVNRQMHIECGNNCRLKHLCGNQRFQRDQNASCTVFITEEKGYGLFASAPISKNTFIMEFVGEVVTVTVFKKRAKEYEKAKIRHHYIMSGAGNTFIDATKKGNLTRFINHSCDPNAETQKWTVNGETRIGIFTTKEIKIFEEITINYQFQRFGNDAQICYCESENCSGWIGAKPK